MNAPQDLHERLAREADGFFRRGGTTLELDQVLDRAGEIKRGRRMRATLLMAACMLAIAVPSVLVAIDRDATTEPSPARRTHVDDSPLTLGDLKVGDSPQGGYSEDGTWQLRVAANGLGSLRGRVVAAAAVKDGVMVAMRTQSGETTAHFIYSQGGTSERSWPMADASGFAVSEGGTVAAFVEPDGTPVVVQDRGTRSLDLPRIPRGSGFTAVAVEGEDCAVRSGDACKVFVATNGAQPESWLVTPSLVVPTDPELHQLADVWTGDVAAGITAVHDDLTTCSAVETGGQSGTGWATCRHRFKAFSPDGTRLLATASAGDGMGDSELAVLDSRTGKVQLDLRTAQGAVITQMVWEDDEHVLAVVFEKGRWAVLRIGLDGSREYAVEPLRSADSTESPFVLPTR